MPPQNHQRVQENVLSGASELSKPWLDEKGNPSRVLPLAVIQAACPHWLTSKDLERAYPHASSTRCTLVVSTPSGCCSPTACGRPPAASQQRSGAAGPLASPPRPWIFCCAFSVVTYNGFPSSYSYAHTTPCRSSLGHYSYTHTPPCRSNLGHYSYTHTPPCRSNPGRYSYTHNLCIRLHPIGRPNPASGSTRLEGK